MKRKEDKHESADTSEVFGAVARVGVAGRGLFIGLTILATGFSLYAIDQLGKRQQYLDVYEALWGSWAASIWVITLSVSLVFSFLLRLCHVKSIRRVIADGAVGGAGAGTVIGLLSVVLVLFLRSVNQRVAYPGSLAYSPVDFFVLTASISVVGAAAGLSIGALVAIGQLTGTAVGKLHVIKGRWLPVVVTGVGTGLISFMLTFIGVSPDSVTAQVYGSWLSAHDICRPLPPRSPSAIRLQQGGSASGRRPNYLRG